MELTSVLGVSRRFQGFEGVVGNIRGALEGLRRVLGDPTTLSTLRSKGYFQSFSVGFTEGVIILKRS